MTYNYTYINYNSFITGTASAEVTVPTATARDPKPGSARSKDMTTTLVPSDAMRWRRLLV